MPTVYPLNSTTLSDVKYVVYPEAPIQLPELSIVDSTGRYDMSNLSNHEIDVVNEVLQIVSTKKYPHDMKAIGLANEASVIRYKPRYILHEIIVQRHSFSEVPYDMLAVGEAYRTMGAMFYNEALSFLERYFMSASLYERKTAQLYLFNAREPFLSHNIAELLNKVGSYDEALEYALRAKAADCTHAPGYVQLIGDIYRKIDPNLAVSFYDDVIREKEYQSYSSLFAKERENAVVALSKKPYKRRPYKPPQDTIEFYQAVATLAKEFMPKGRYYKSSIFHGGY